MGINNKSSSSSKPPPPSTVPDDAGVPDEMDEDAAPLAEVAVGIDLGTTYSCVAVQREMGIEVLANDQGNRTTPSYVSFDDTQRLVGDAAWNQAARNPVNTIFDAKRLIGRKFGDTEVQKDRELWPFQVISGSKGNPKIAVTLKGERKEFDPEEISAMVLGKMKETAESVLNRKVTKAVVTVPAYFNDAQRQSTKDAGRIAGLEVLRILNEPTAAAIAYGMNSQAERAGAGERNILVYDLGGGTFDVSVLQLEENVFEVKATAGDTHLGGEDFDSLLVDHCVKEFERKNPGVIQKTNLKEKESKPPASFLSDFGGLFGMGESDPKDAATDGRYRVSSSSTDGTLPLSEDEILKRMNSRALRRLRTQCERAKRALSGSTQVTIEVDSLYGGIDFNLQLSRAFFEKLCDKHFKRTLDCMERPAAGPTIDCVEDCLRESGVRKQDVHDLVLVGGSSRIPKIKTMLDEYFGFAGSPKRASSSSTASEGRRVNSINPDEAVAYGAAVQAAILTKTHSGPDVLLLDVTPISLGIQTAGGAMTVVIPRNSTVPLRKTRGGFSTAVDNQRQVLVQVFEGERPLTKDNNLLGKFQLTDIAPAPRAVPKIEVMFDIDKDGMLTVQAEETTNGGNSRAIQISNECGRLSKEEIEQHILDAARFNAQDREIKAVLAARNSLENYCFSAKSTLESDAFAKLVSRSERKKAQNAVAKTLEWLEKEQTPELVAVEKIRTGLEELVQPLLKKQYTGVVPGGEGGMDLTEGGRKKKGGCCFRG